jgi:hypothetical protein
MLELMLHRDDLPIQVTVAGSPDDPRFEKPAPEGVEIFHVPNLHPDDVVTLPSGLRVTSVERTLIDLAEILSREELREVFQNARERGMLDIAALRRSRARVEWRPSLAMLDAVIAEFEA